MRPPTASSRGDVDADLAAPHRGAPRHRLRSRGSRAARTARRPPRHGGRRRVAAAGLLGVRPIGAAPGASAAGAVGGRLGPPGRRAAAGPPRWSAPGPRPPTASTSPPTSPRGWRRATWPWSPAAPTASTVRRTARRWPSDGLTVAVLAAGIDVPYPAGHAALLRRIAEDGLVVSEYPPGVRPGRLRFLTRNRLVAALSGATVVVEAGARSGAASTAAWARTLGRPVCAVPGPVTSSASVGCHALLRDGAEPGHPGRGHRRTRGPDRRARPRRAAADIAARRARRGAAAGVRRAACPRSPHRRPDRGGGGPSGDRTCSDPLAMMEVRAWSRSATASWKLARHRKRRPPGTAHARIIVEATNA